MNNKVVGTNVKTINTLKNNEVLMYGGLKTSLQFKSGLCVVYKGLYTRKNYEFDKVNNKRFISSHNIIKFSDDVYSSVYPDPLECYDYIREEYLKGLTEGTMDESMKQIVKTYGAHYYKNGIKIY